MFHFYFETPNIADWISIAGTAFAIILAIYAFFHWRKQKEWDIIIEAVAHARAGYKMVFHSYGESFKDHMVENEYVELLKVQDKYIGRNTGLEERIRMIHAKLNFVFKGKPHVTKTYYNLLVRLLNELDQYFVWVSIQKTIEEIKKKPPEEQAVHKEFVEKTRKKPRNKLSRENLDLLRKLRVEVSNYSISRWWYFF